MAAVEGKKGDKLRFGPGQTPLSFLPPPPFSLFLLGEGGGGGGKERGLCFFSEPRYEIRHFPSK